MMEASRNQEEDLSPQLQAVPPLDSPGPSPGERPTFSTNSPGPSSPSRAKALPKIMRIFMWVFLISYQDICLHFYGNSIFEEA